MPHAPEKSGFVVRPCATCGGHLDVRKSPSLILSYSNLSFLSHNIRVSNIFVCAVLTLLRYHCICLAIVQIEIVNICNTADYSIAGDDVENSTTQEIMHYNTLQ